MIRVLQYIGSLKLGGSQTFIMEIYRKIDRTIIQFDFVVFSGEEGFFCDEIKSLGGKVFVSPRYCGKNHISFIRWWNDFLKNHLEYKIVHFHVRSIAAICIPMVKKRAMVAIVHSHSTSNGNGLSAIVKKMMQYPLRYQADYFFACSKEAGKWLFGKRAVERDNFKVICNGINCDRFRYNEADRMLIRKEFGIENNFVIGHVGRHTAAKNPIFLIEVFAAIYKQDSNARLLQIGQGETTEQMKQKCCELSIQDAVIFAGVHNDVEKYYSAMDVFLFPSLWEGLGIVVVEAQTSGLHCIVSREVPVLANIGAGLFHDMDLEKSAEEWATLTFSFKDCERSADKVKYARHAGFDINDTTKYLNDFYYALAGNGR